jgi:hypothetical protein
LLSINNPNVVLDNLQSVGKGHTEKEGGIKMPYILTRSLYPSTKAMEVVDVYFELLKKYPFDESLGTQVVPGASKTTTQGVEVLSVTEINEGKLEEALQFTRKRLAMFHGVEGMGISIEVYATMAEGLETIGVKLPE